MGLCLIVTRPAAQAAEWVRQLTAMGLQARALPLIGIAPVADAAPLRAAWQGLAQRRLVVFVSPNAVQHFLAAAPLPVAWPPGVLAGSTGPGTTRALRHAGVPPAQIVEPAAEAGQFDSEALWARLQPMDWAGQRVLVVRGEDGRDWLAQALRARGAEVDFVAAYRRLPPQLDASGQALLDAARVRPAQHLWLFSSSEAVAWLRTLAPAADWSASRALASHPRIVEAARELGFGWVQMTAPAALAVAEVAARLDLQRQPAVPDAAPAPSPMPTGPSIQ